MIKDAGTLKITAPTHEQDMKWVLFSQSQISALVLCSTCSLLLPRLHIWAAVTLCGGGGSSVGLQHQQQTQKHITTTTHTLAHSNTMVQPGDWLLLSKLITVTYTVKTSSQHPKNKPKYPGYKCCHHVKPEAAQSWLEGGALSLSLSISQTHTHTHSHTHTHTHTLSLSLSLSLCVPGASPSFRGHVPSTWSCFT